MFSSKLLTEIIENDFLIRTRPHRVRHPYHTDFSSALVRTVAQVEMHWSSSDLDQNSLDIGQCSGESCSVIALLSVY